MFKKTLRTFVFKYFVKLLAKVLIFPQILLYEVFSYIRTVKFYFSFIHLTLP